MPKSFSKYFFIIVLLNYCSNVNIFRKKHGTDMSNISLKRTIITEITVRYLSDTKTNLFNDFSYQNELSKLTFLNIKISPGNSKNHTGKIRLKHNFFKVDGLM